MSTMPKFNFNQSAIKTDEDLAKALAGGKSETPYLQEGVHDVQVTEARWHDKPVSDPSWKLLLLTVEGAGKRSLKTSVMVPTSSFEYLKPGSKPTVLPFKKLNEFATAIGLPQITVSNAGDVLTESFSKPEKSLIGRNLRVTIGYQGNHVFYAGKDTSGGKKFTIKMGDGSTLATNGGQTIVFPDRDAAMAHAEQNQIKIQKFADVTRFESNGGNRKAPSDF